MSATILDGRKLSTEIREELKARTRKLEETGVTPGIAGILVGDDPGSATYIGLKEKAAGDVGIRSQMVRLPQDIKLKRLMLMPGFMAFSCSFLFPSTSTRAESWLLYHPGKMLMDFIPAT